MQEQDALPPPAVALAAAQAVLPVVVQAVVQAAVPAEVLELAVEQVLAVA